MDQGSQHTLSRDTARQEALSSQDCSAGASRVWSRTAQGDGGTVLPSQQEPQGRELSVHGSRKETENAS